MEPNPTRFQDRRQFVKALLLALPALSLAPRLLTAAPRRMNELSLAFIASSLPLVRRAAWADRRPNTGRLRVAGYFSRITIHHSGARVLRATERGRVVQALNEILAAHQRIRYGDLGYHLAIDCAGRVWEGRSLSYEGAHVSGENPGNIGVMLLGNFEKQKPSSPQLDTLATLVGLLRKQFDIPARRVYGHRDIGSSVCPGRYLYPFVVSLKRNTPPRALV